ncbi:hypothetical protein GVAV_000521 [Gurleya vavrai]
MNNYKNLSLSQIPPYLTQTIPVFSTLNTIYSISPVTKNASLLQHLIPLFFAFFTGPLAANLVHPYFKPSPELLAAFLVGLVISLPFSNIKAFKMISTLGPLLGKVTMVIDMKNSKSPIYLLCFWFSICFIVGSAVNKIIIKKKVELSEEEFADLIGTIFCISVCRFYMFCDIYCFLIVLLNYLMTKKACLNCCFKTKKIVEENILSDSDDKRIESSSGPLTMPRRRIASTAVTPKKEKDDEQKTRRGRPKKTESKTNTPKKKSTRKISFDDE